MKSGFWRMLGLLLVLVTSTEVLAQYTCEKDCKKQCTRFGITEPMCFQGCKAWQALNCNGELGPSVWGELGSKAYPARAIYMAERWPAESAIRNYERPLLERYFDADLLDRVRVHYNANFPTEMRIGSWTVFVSSDAQTFGYAVYVRADHATVSSDEEILIEHFRNLVHELYHTAQYVNRGRSLQRFGYDYFYGYAEAGRNYSGNPMEKEAEEFELAKVTEIRQYVAQLLGSPIPSRRALSEYNTDCRFPSSLSNACVSAIHRYVEDKGFGGAGLPQEIGNNAFGIMAVNPDWYGDISVSELRGIHSGCAFADAQGSACVAAIHRACNQRGYGAGFAQEIGDQVFGVACVRPAWYGEMSIGELRGLHSGCAFPATGSSGCVAAIHRACNARGHTGGYAQEIGNQVFGVACFDGKYVEAPVEN